MTVALSVLSEVLNEQKADFLEASALMPSKTPGDGLAWITWLTHHFSLELVQVRLVILGLDSQDV